MLGVHVRLNLKNEARKNILRRFDDPRGDVMGLGRRGVFEKPVEHEFDAKIIRRAAEEYRRGFTREHRFRVER